MRSLTLSLSLLFSAVIRNPTASNKIAPLMKLIGLMKLFIFLGKCGLKQPIIFQGEQVNLEKQNCFYVIIRLRGN
jgi:hypothetical protein